MSWFIEDAYAQAGGQPDALLSFLPLILIFVVFLIFSVRG